MARKSLQSTLNRANSTQTARVAQRGKYALAGLAESRTATSVTTAIRITLAPLSRDEIRVVVLNVFNLIQWRFDLLGKQSCSNIQHSVETPKRLCPSHSDITHRPQTGPPLA
jgi:hypothetical protein